MREIIPLSLALLLFFTALGANQTFLLRDADMLLDMMEYKAALENYLKALPQHPNQRDLQKKIAYAYLELKETNEALKYIKEELDLFPDNVDAYDLLVYVLFKENNLGEADSFLRRHGFPFGLTEKIPSLGGLALFILGVHLKEGKEYGRANEYLSGAIDKGYDPVKCYVQLIDIELIRESPDSARSLIIKASRVHGTQPEFLFMDGLRYIEKMRTNDYFLLGARESFEKAVELNPAFKEALYNLACLSYNFHDFGKAVENFNRLLAIDPEDKRAKFYLHCAQGRIEKEDREESLTDCPQRMEISRGFVNNSDREYRHRFINDVNLVVENINYLGLEFIRQGKLHDAIRVFRNGLKFSPESPEIHFNLGMVFSWLNYLKDAEEHALMALRRRRFFGRLPAKRIQQILVREGKSITKALEVPLSEWTFETALKEGNHFSDAYDLLGNIYFKRGDFTRSVQAFKKVIEIYSEDAVGHYNLACAYWALNDKESAEEEWKKAIQYEKEAKEQKERAEVSEDQLSISLLVLKRPVSCRAHKSLGRLYMEKGQKDKALEEFEKVVKLDPSDPEPYYELGKIYQERQNIEKAISLYEKYLYLGGKKEDEAKRILHSLRK